MNQAINLSIPGKMNYDEMLFLSALAKRVPRGGKIIEVGSFFGRSTHVIAKSNPFAQVVSIDTFENVQWTDRYAKKFNEIPVFGKEAFLKFIADCPNVRPIEGFSPDVVNDWAEPIDMYFEDAIHGNPAFKRNIDFWIGHLKPGGIACGHDYTLRFPDIKREIDALALKWRSKVEIVGSLWALQKPLEASSSTDLPAMGLTPALTQEPMLILRTKNVHRKYRRTHAGFWAGAHLDADRLTWISIEMPKATNLQLQYRVRHPKTGVTEWTNAPERLSLTKNAENLGFTGLSCQLLGKDADRYYISYRVSSRQVGNGGFYKSGISDWAHNGQWALVGKGSVPVNAITVSISRELPPSSQEEFTRKPRSFRKDITLKKIAKKIKQMVS